MRAHHREELIRLLDALTHIHVAQSDPDTASHIEDAMDAIDRALDDRGRHSHASVKSTGAAP